MPPQEENDLPLNSTVFYWPKLILAGLLILFIATNIALVRRYRYEKNLRVNLEKKQQGYKKSLKQAGLQEMVSWQGELKAWPIVEEGMVLFYQKKYKEALEKFNLIIDAGLKNIPIAYFFRAQIFYELEQYENCITDMTIYKDIIVSSHYALFIRAKSYKHLGKEKLAISDLEQAIAETDNFTQAKDLLDMWTK